MPHLLLWSSKHLSIITVFNFILLFFIILCLILSFFCFLYSHSHKPPCNHTLSCPSSVLGIVLFLLSPPLTLLLLLSPAVSRLWQDYVEPGDELEAGSPMKRSSRNLDGEEEPVLPLAENVLSRNLGLHVIVVVTKVMQEIIASAAAVNTLAQLHSH